MALASISVIIPAYNAEETIGEAIASVMQQSLPVQEILVIDDGSTDGTAERVHQSYPDVLVITVPNGGPSKARNEGIWRARGEWIAFLDADDQWHGDKLRVQMKVATPNIALVASDWVRGNDFQPVPEPVPTSRLGYRDLLSLNQFQTSTVIMRRTLANELGGFDAALDGAEDWDFWLRASGRTEIIKVDWPLVQYRDMPSGYSKDVWRVYTTMQPMLDKHRGTREISARDFGIIEAWHHLRFWVAFGLAHDKHHAKEAWRNARQLRLRPYFYAALFSRVMPFLWRRLRKRAV